MSLVFSIIKPILPEILLLILALLILALDLALPKEQRRFLGWVTATGMGLVILLNPQEKQQAPADIPHQDVVVSTEK